MTHLNEITRYYRTLISKHAAQSPSFFTPPTVKRSRMWVKHCRRGMVIGKAYRIAAQ